MKKLTYVIALCAFLLAGCSQDEAIVENKGELVTLNYKVSLGKNIQSRNTTGDDTSSEGTSSEGTSTEGTTPELAVNKLICAVFENGNEIKRDTVDVIDGAAEYSPQLFTNIEYNIVFWAYYENSNQSCFNMDDVTKITINGNYGQGNFAENKYMDAFTQVDTVIVNKAELKPTVSLTRPFAQVNVFSSKNDYDIAITYGKTPTSSKIKLIGYADTYNALTKKWTGSAESTVLTSPIQVTDDVVCYASNYVFGYGDVTTCIITVLDDNSEKIMSMEVPSVPLGINKRTNMKSENLLTGGGVTYTITVGNGFMDEDINKDI